MSAMPPLVLDHLSAPSIYRRQVAALVVLGLVAGGLGAVRLAELRAQADELGASLARGVQLQVQRTASRQAAGSIQAAPSVRWERLFEVLERAASQDVTLLVFDPSPPQRQLRLEGEARDLPALLDYLRKLGAAGPLVQVRLQSHQTVRDDPQHPVHFTIVASWEEST